MSKIQWERDEKRMTEDAQIEEEGNEDNTKCLSLSESSLSWLTPIKALPESHIPRAFANPIMQTLTMNEAAEAGQAALRE